MVLSSGLSQLRLLPGESLHLWQIFLQNLRLGQDLAGPVLPSGEEAGVMIDFLRIIFWLTVPFAIIYAIISPRYRRTLFRTFVTMFILLYLFNNWPKDELSAEDLAALEAANAALENADFALPDPPSFVRAPRAVYASSRGCPVWVVPPNNVCLQRDRWAGARGDGSPPHRRLPNPARARRARSCSAAGSNR